MFSWPGWSACVPITRISPRVAYSADSGERLRSVSTELGRRPPEEGNWRLRNWRVRARLVALILVPTAAAVLLGGFQVFTSTGAAADYERTSRLAQLSGQVGALTH